MPDRYDRLLRPLLFRYGGGDPERVHEATLAALARLSSGRAGQAALRALTRRYRYPADNSTSVFGIRFPNPVGLAAGLDKDGRALPAWPALGFGFVEVGTVTRHAQPGNPRPRLFRLPESEAVINRMGFNNAGAHALATRLGRMAVAGRSLPVPLGISLGKSKVTPIDEAVGDYLVSLRALYRFGDYFAINVSSPNTPGLRSLQDGDQLAALVKALVAEARTMSGSAPAKPILVKVAPDLTDPALAEVLAVCSEHGAAGLIATNTTLSRDGLARPVTEAGGLSGRPLTERAREVVSFVHRETGGKLPVIGVGGILEPADALRLLDAGASLVQVYTGFIYRGPELVRQINRAVAQTVGPRR